MVRLSGATALSSSGAGRDELFRAAVLSGMDHMYPTIDFEADEVSPRPRPRLRWRPALFPNPLPAHVRTLNADSGRPVLLDQFDETQPVNLKSKPYILNRELALETRVEYISSLP